MKNKKLLLGIIVTAAMIFVVIPAIFFILLMGTGTFQLGDGVGLVEVDGVIADSRETVQQLKDMEKDERVKAVVLRVDSPGGVVGPSQEIYAQVKKLAARKKVVVSMGSLAASGGYYISAPASLIMANPGTITGSIGVIMKFPDLEGLMGKLGIKATTLKTGKFKDAGSSLRAMNEQDRAMLQGVIDSAHGQFVRAVAEGRKLPFDEVAKIADGRIFTGEQAMALKLIDRIGTLQDAIEQAGKMGGIKGEPRIIQSDVKANSWLDLLMESAASRMARMAEQKKELSVRYEYDGAMR